MYGNLASCTSIEVINLLLPLGKLMSFLTYENCDSIRIFKPILDAKSKFKVLVSSAYQYTCNLI